MRHLQFIACILIFITSCTNKIKDDIDTINRIDSLIQVDPNKALNFIDSSIVLVTNDTYKYNLYLLYRIKAKDYASKSISSNTEVEDIYNFFINHSENEILTCLSAYYCGRIYENKKEKDKALRYYRITLDLAQKNDMKSILGMTYYALGKMKLEHVMLDNARANLYKSEKIFSKLEDNTHIIKTRKLLGLSHLLNMNEDSAFYYYDKALEVAIKTQDKEEEALILQDKGVGYNMLNKTKQAISCFQNALKADSLSSTTSLILINLAETQLKTGNADLAQHYIDKSLNLLKKDSLDNRSNMKVYLRLFQIAENRKNYKDALEHHKSYSKYMSGIIFDRMNESLIDAEQKYKFEVVQTENANLSVKNIKKQRLIFLLLLLTAVLSALYALLLLRKNKQLIRANEDILSLSENIRESDISSREQLINTLNIIRRAAELEFLVKDTGNKQGQVLIKKFNAVMYGKEIADWEYIYEILNSMHKEYFNKIRIFFPELDESEYRICCLNCAGFKADEISVIMQLKVNTINAKLSAIRKKIGIKKYAKIIHYVNDRINDNLDFLE